MTPLLVLLIAYVLGAIPFGYLLVKFTTGADVRASGSGNIGATNVMRTTGRGAGIATLLLDIAKGYLAVWIAGRLTGGDPMWMSAAALAVMAGHAFPVFLRFRGGKAVASFVGAFLCLTPLAMVCALVVFAGVVAATRHISMASICAAVTFPLAVWIVAQPRTADLLDRGGGGWVRYFETQSEYPQAAFRNRAPVQFRYSPLTRLAIIGAGSWGTALAIALGPKFPDIRLWAYEPDLAERLRTNRINDIYLHGFEFSRHVAPTHDLQTALA